MIPRGILAFDLPRLSSKRRFISQSINQSINQYHQSNDRVEAHVTVPFVVGGRQDVTNKDEDFPPEEVLQGYQRRNRGAKRYVSIKMEARWLGDEDADDDDDD